MHLHSSARCRLQYYEPDTRKTQEKICQAKQNMIVWESKRVALFRIVESL